LIQSNNLKKTAENWYLIGKCQLILGDEIQAKDSYLQAEFLDKNHFLALQSLGELYLKQKHYHEAL